jgi:hypothetical protein
LDSGQSWERVESKEMARDIFFLGPKVGWVVSDSVLYKVLLGSADGVQPNRPAPGFR